MLCPDYVGFLGERGYVVGRETGVYMNYLEVARYWCCVEEMVVAVVVVAQWLCTTSVLRYHCGQ